MASLQITTNYHNNCHYCTIIIIVIIIIIIIITTGIATDTIDFQRGSYIGLHLIRARSLLAGLRVHAVTPAEMVWSEWDGSVSADGLTWVGSLRV